MINENAKCRQIAIYGKGGKFVSRHYQALLCDLEVNPVVIGNRSE